MGWSILLNADKTEMEFGIFKFNKDKDPNDPDEPLELNLEITLTKKDVKHLINDLQNWNNIMEDKRIKTKDKPAMELLRKHYRADTHEH